MFDQVIELYHCDLRKSPGVNPRSVLILDSIWGLRGDLAVHGQNLRFLCVCFVGICGWLHPYDEFARAVVLCFFSMIAAM